MKRLQRSTSSKMISGVCGGIGEYFNVDPTLIRIIWALITIFTGFFVGVLLYVVCAVVMPYGFRADDTGQNDWHQQ